MFESVHTARFGSGARGRAALRIAVVAGPWITVPPPGYGGIEEVVALLCEELVARGHDVTLFAPPGSRSYARVHVPLDRPHPDTIGSALHEANHVGCVWDAVDDAGSGAWIRSRAPTGRLRPRASQADRW